MRSEVLVPWLHERRPLLERVLLGLVARVLLFALIIFLMQAFVFNGLSWTAYAAAFLILLAVLFLFESWRDRSRRRAQHREARFKAWLVLLNVAASKRGYHDFDFSGSDEWRGYFDEGLTVEQALNKGDRRL